MPRETIHVMLMQTVLILLETSPVHVKRDMREMDITVKVCCFMITCGYSASYSEEVVAIRMPGYTTTY